MQVDITVDTEALVVDAYPMMKDSTRGVSMTDFDIAWGFYCAMLKAHPEMVGAYRGRMEEMIKAVRDIELAASPHRLWWTDEERAEDAAIQRDAAMRGMK